MSLQRWLVKAILIHGGSQLFLIVLYVTGVLLIELANVLQPDNKLHLAMVSVGIVAACSVYLLFAVVVVAYPQYLLLIYTIAYVEGRDGQPERDKGWLVYGWHHHPAGMVVAYIIVTAVAVGEAVSEHMETGNSWHDTLFDLTWVANQMLVLVTAALEYTMAASGTTRYESDVRDKTVDNHLTVGKLMVLDALAPDQHWQRLTMCRLVQLLAAGVVARGEYLEPMPNSNYYVALFFVGCALAEAGAPLKFQAGHVFTKFYTTSASVWGRVLEFAERKVVGERVG